VNNWLNIIQKKLLPPRCILCAQPGQDDLDLCADCVAELPQNLCSCYRCGEHFAQPFANPQLCGRCINSPPAFDDTQAPFLYQGNIRYLISQLKFAGHYKNARLLGLLLANHLSHCAQPAECILPVPLHPHRYRQRGFNQSIEIARHVATQLHLPLDLHSCIRNRDTQQQSDLPAEQRRRNLKQAFSLVKPPAYKHIAILDDVMTTGTTAAALAQVLKAQGVERVDVWVCARA
jgi:ComF family protein